MHSASGNGKALDIASQTKSPPLSRLITQANKIISLMAAPMLLRGIPLLRFRLRLRISASDFITTVGRPSFCTATEPSQPHDDVTRATESAKYAPWENSDHRKWKKREAEILRDVEPITSLTKEILHSNRYIDGQRLTAEDEKAVVEKLLNYHPHSEDKIGCGLDSIIVDRHPRFRQSRCLFVVRTDGGWIDFSYQKCLRAYIQDKYPSHAETYIQAPV